MYRIPAVGVPQGRELVNAVPSLIKRGNTRLKRALVAGKFIAKHPSCPDWLLGIIDGLPGTWSSIEDFRTQVSTISTNIYPWKGNKNTNAACCVHETQQLSAMELQYKLTSLSASPLSVISHVLTVEPLLTDTPEKQTLMT